MEFFGGPVDPLVSQLVNYSITTARVFANVLAAVVLVKLGPKKAAGTAIGLLLFCIIAVYLPNYWAYTAARMVMAVGGSMVIVYMNPVVANYISNSKTKLRINAANTVSYNVGAFIVAVLFTLFADTLVADWQNTLTAFASLTLVFFIAWLVVAEDFETGASNANATKNGEKIEEYGYKDALKDGFLWRYGMGFAAFLCLYVMTLVNLKPIFDQYTLLNGSVTALLISGFGILGTFAGIWVGNKGFQRRPTLILAGLGMTLSFIVAIYFANSIPMLSYALIALSGFIMFIQYPLYLNFAHELPKMYPQKLTIMFGLFWAMGYGGFTIFQIIWSYILGEYGYQPSMIFWAITILFYVGLVATFPETRPKAMPKGGTKAA
jgi:MFS family permease